MIVEQEVFDLLADEAPSDPEKVQVVALLSLFWISGAGVTAGSGTGAAMTDPMHSATAKATQDRF